MLCREEWLVAPWPGVAGCSLTGAAHLIHRLDRLYSLKIPHKLRNCGRGCCSYLKVFTEENYLVAVTYPDDEEFELLSDP